MAEAFDPDEYLAEKEAEKYQDSGEFDPDEYLKEKAGEEYQSPSMDFAQAVKDVAGAVAGIADYPSGIARQGAASIYDISRGLKSSAEAGGDMLASAIPGGGAISSQDLMRKFGVSDKPILPENPNGFDPLGPLNVPRSAAAGAALDLGMAIPEAELMGAGLKGIAKSGRALINPEEMALKATGIRKKATEEMLQGKTTEPFKKMEDVAGYAQENIITPLSGPTKMLQKTREKLGEVGFKIGEIRDRAEKLSPQKFNTLLSSPEFMGKSFIPEFTKENIFAKIDQEIADPHYAEQVKNIVGAKLDALGKKFGASEILNPATNKIELVPKPVPLKELTRLKASWQRDVLDKFAGDFTLRQDAYNYLKNAANDSIVNEIKLSEAALGGNDLSKHRSLSKEYSQLNTINDGLVDRISKQASSDAGIIHHLTTPVTNRITTMAASLPKVGPINMMPNAKSLIGANIIEAGNLQNMNPYAPTNNMIEGFQENQTDSIYNQVMSQPLPPMMTQEQAMTMFEGQARDKIQKNSGLSNTEKAKRINLLNKHGRVYLGQ